MPRGVFKTKPTGRPVNPIDWKLFEQLCGIFCTQSEIASFLKICVDTLAVRVQKQYNQPYSEVYKKFQETGKCSLRRYQFAMAAKNASMAIWLGKQYLGQKDHEDKKDIPPNDPNLTITLDLIKEIHKLRAELETLKNAVPKTDPFIQPSEASL